MLQNTLRVGCDTQAVIYHSCLRVKVLNKEEGAEDAYTGEEGAPETTYYVTHAQFLNTPLIKMLMMLMRGSSWKKNFAV